VKTYEAVAERDERDGRWWLVRVPGVGITQARRLSEVEPMARDLIATVLDVAADSFEVRVVNAGEADIVALAAERAAEPTYTLEEVAAEIAARPDD
jgi:hypothetical protein